ncbi:MAG: antitoxin Xre-like helix-turn-helix domain-containing protein [Rhodothalassiaceae bacterium]
MPLIAVAPETALGSEQENAQETAAAGARAVVALFRRWGLTDQQACTLLGGLSASTYNRWKRGQVGRIGPDLTARLSNLLGIHKALRILLVEPGRSYDWVHRPNAAFGGASALEIMLGGDLTDLMRVRAHLDAARG